MPKTDIDGYPTICMVCEKPIVKSKQQSQHHYDVASQEASSWHTECSRSPHLFFCKGKPALVEMIMGSWVCSVCGDAVNWVVT